MKRAISFYFSLALTAAVGLASAMAQDNTWPSYNGDLKAQKYSPADQITPQNVGRLQKAWEVHTGDVSDGSGVIPMSVWSGTPLFINDTVYVGTPFYNILAIEPDTGKVKWRYNAHALLKALTQPDMKNRGIAYWAAANPVAGQPCQKRIYIGTMDAKLHSVDADTGNLCADFGDKGILDINKYNTVNNKWPLSLFQAPTVYKDKLFLGWSGKDWSDAVDPPGWVWALDARTGKTEWTFNPIPKEMWGKTGTSNVWASMSFDPDMNILYLPVSSPSPNFYGGDRLDPIPLATSVTALDGDSGKVIWSRQLVHHDLWDMDTNSAPTLVDIEKDGKKIPALVQTSKQGFLYVLNRYTGEPIYPIEERPVPASDVPGEKASPTQPYVARPEPVVADRWPGVYWLADALSLGYCSRKAKELRDEGRFTPPSLKGTIAYPSTISGVEWGGGAVDPESQTFITNSSVVVMIEQLIPRDEYNKVTSVPGSEASGGYFPQKGAPYGLQINTFTNPIGMPCWKPPYGQISAYDLKTGDLLWRKPMGAVQQWGFYMPDSWGSVTLGGPVITKGGVAFIGASMDHKVRAFDVKTGDVLWKAMVDAPAVSIPAVYTYKGKQYVVFAVGGNSILTPRVSDQVVAFALPDGTTGQ
ncbi:pyrroloquinoline quinone-dependent dehydrogenase [Phyllobacterium leguminum]|uniref:Quinoprotein glucose dehydrogenase n=1 Tax=Phyllobacterium leguminum TaxID=314237 RepID=A0A318T4M5_9HYPH|nr:pyrroloquinoline quinone-dependent dehydrogenase [Phyllobacterium leguminum]PYE85264.1 quinoprotein glucose dehydrogenase [Phyllobacterium leguminum]